MRATFPRWRAAAGVVALVTAVSACTAGSTDSGGGAGGGPRVRVAVGIDAAYAPFFVADQKGLFKKHGVNVQVVQFGRGGEAVDAIATGRVQFAGSSDVTTIGQLQQNPDLRALLAFQQSGKYLKVVTRKDVDPAKIKTMGIVPGLSELAAIRFLQSRKIDPSTVKFVPAGPPEIPALLQKSDIDAYVLWEPWPAKGVALGGKVLESTGDYGMSYVQWLIGGNKGVSADPGTAVKIAKALREAVRMVENDPQGAAQATRKAAKVPPEQTVKAVQEIDFAVRDLTAADLANSEKIADFYVATGKLKAKPDVATALMQGWFSKRAGGPG